MNTIVRVDGAELSHDARVQLYMDVLNMSEADAEFLIAIEEGEVSGDLIQIDAEGNETQ